MISTLSANWLMSACLLGGIAFGWWVRGKFVDGETIDGSKKC